MQDITLKEINKFRILSSKYIVSTENEISEDFKDLQGISINEINTELIKKIFDLLEFPYGGSIWVEAEFITRSQNLVIKLGEHRLATHEIPQFSVEPNESAIKIHPIRIDAFFYRDEQEIKKCSLSARLPDTLENFRYNLFRKQKYNSNPANFERHFRNRGPFIDREKYYRSLRETNLPITYSMETLDKIKKEYSNDPLNDPNDNNYILLRELARFIEHNKLHKDSEKRSCFQDIFTVYKKDRVPSLSTDDRELNEAFIHYSDYYRKTYINEEDSIRRTVRWANKFLTLENISTLLKKVITFSPVIFGFSTILIFMFLIRTTEGNLNFAFSLYSALRDEISSHILFFTSIGFLTFLYVLVSYQLLARPYEALLKRIFRSSGIVQNSFTDKVLRVLIFIVFVLGIITISFVSIFPPLLSLVLIPILFITSAISVSHMFSNDSNIFYIPKNLSILIVALAITIPTFCTFFDSSKLYSQSCAYKIIDGKVYRYRYFETGNWADKTELAILPGSTNKWIDNTALQLPTRITVLKSDLRSMQSCTDQYSTWDEAEKDFVRKEIEFSTNA